MGISDRYGLDVTTSSPVAAARFQVGMDRLLSYGAGADESFAAAVLADERLAVAHAGMALVAGGPRGPAPAPAPPPRPPPAVNRAPRPRPPHRPAGGGAPPPGAAPRPRPGAP